ncbi:hypothetical protein IGI04_026530 [Brassica rapa subsp. trilocularis]|uniref:Reverse transcriptase zinc-binding domain-containing protein n=1 Tax=Brassica rapa subsp. trilocularis TaxID=1813537 RepID=A0ABQ7L054_BRACM|nr:hypothetical protein IGI04_026530 [Brassica rapa subsp. trilocularis]
MVIGLSRPAVVKWISAGQRAAVSRKADQTCPAKYPTCLLCNNHLEFRDHIFFLCYFTPIVWRPLSSKLGLKPLTLGMIQLARSQTSWEPSVSNSWLGLLGRWLSKKFGDNGTFRSPVSLLSMIDQSDNHKQDILFQAGDS